MSAEAKRILESLNVSDFKDRRSTMSLPTIAPHTEVGHYSSDEENNFKPDYSELKYLHLPVRMDRVNFDLNVAHARAIRRQPKTSPLDSNMDDILRWCLLNKTQLAKTSSQSPQFICTRGILTKIMCSPTDQCEDWIIRATRYKGNIYLCRLVTDQEILSDLTQTDRDKLMRIWGYKFEQYLTSDSPTCNPEDPSIPVNELREFCSMVRTSVADIPLLISGEVDALRPEFYKQQGQNSGSTSGYVELKTSRIVSHIGQERTLKRKMGKWWAQSFILGVPTVICGFRDESGVVRAVKEYQTKDLPGLSAGFWHPTVCLNFLKTFLELVSRYVVKDDPSVVYKFEWHPGQKTTCQEMEQPETYRFLPDWYLLEV